MPIICGVYKLYWDTCPSFYIGASYKINHRFARHKADLERGDHANKEMANLYLLNGHPKLEVIELCERNTLLERESFFITQNIDNEFMCNSIFVDRRIPFGNIRGKVRRPSNRWTEDRREKSKNWWADPENKKKVNLSRVGKTASQHTREKMRAWCLRNKDSIGEKRKGHGNSMAKKVINIQTGELFECAMYAAAHAGINKTTFRERINPNGKVRNNTNYVYLEDYLSNKECSMEDFLKNRKAA